MKALNLWKWICFVSLLMVVPGIHAQQSNQVNPTHSGAPAQVVDPINDGNLLSLPSRSLSLFRPDRDRGPVASNMVLGRMHLLLKRSAAQEAALQSLIRSQQDIHSPQYHHWLTAEEVGAQYGPAQEDIDKITAWLQTKGIKINSVAKGRTSIEFSATHQQLKHALHTELHWFDTDAGRQYNNVAAPKIPAALGPVVAGVSSLNSLVSKPQSHVVRQNRGKSDVSGNPPSDLAGSMNYLAPGDFWTIYNATPTETSGITGKGVTIGIAGRSDVAASDVAAFRSTYLGSSYAGTYRQIVNGPDPGTPSGDDTENVLDVEWASALAPNANVVLVSSMTNGEDGVYLSAQYLIDNNLADIVSVSYGLCESFLWFDVVEYSNLWEQAAAQGITVVVAAGDNGSAGCDNAESSQAEYGLQVNGLASSPYNVAVGGTEFVDQGDSWANSTNSTPLPETSAMGYIPEEIWNESQVYSTLYAGSGGKSNCYFSSYAYNPYDTAGCAGGVPKPDWQAGVTGIPADGVRDLPDLSFTAALHDAYVVILQGSTLFVGGTSASAPAFAGVMALVNEKAGGRQGVANYELYSLAGQEFGAAGAENETNLQSCNASLTQNSGNSCVFYDVTSRSNAVPCVGGTEDCSSTSANTAGMLTGYPAETGYDLASGLGSVNITNLVNGWNVPSKGNAPTTTSLQISPTSGIVHGSPVNISVAVTPTSGNGKPSGAVSLIGNGASIATAQLTNGSWSGDISTLPGGYYPVTAQYSGDATYSASTSSQVLVSVNQEPSTTADFIVAKDAQLGNLLPVTAIPYGSNVILNGVVRGQSGIGWPTGYVTFSVGGTSYIAQVNTAGQSAMTVTTIAPGTYSARAVYSGDPSFTSSQGAVPAQFTIVKANTTVSLSSGSPTNGAFPVTAVVSADTFGNFPTGNVAFFVNGAQVGTATVQTDSAATQHWAAAIFNVSVALMTAGSNAITAQYEGDTNYAPSAVSASLPITPNTVTVTSPNPPAAPSLAAEIRTGAQIPVIASIMGTFQNLQVQWAPGMNPTSGWSSNGIALTGNVSQPVLNAPVATWDTTSINTAGYYTISVSATSAGITNTANTIVYVEPDLLSSNWPMSLAGEGVWGNTVPVPVTDSSGETALLFGGYVTKPQLFKTSVDGSAQTSYSLQTGSEYAPTAARLHFEPGDDLVFPDGYYSVIVVRPDGTENTLSAPAIMSGIRFNFWQTQLIVDDVDGDSIPEVVTVASPAAYTNAYLFAWRNNGQQLNKNFPVAIPNLNFDLCAFTSSPVLVGDVDGDGSKEFVVLEGTTASTFTPRLFASDGTPKAWNAPSLNSFSLQMALADLDHNGKLETIIESYDGYLHVLNADGIERTGWPQKLAYWSFGDSIAVSDLNQDGNEEIVLSHGGTLSVFKDDGTEFWTNWIQPSYGGFGPAVIADVNGDGYPEIVVSFGEALVDPWSPDYYYNVNQLLILDRTGTTIRSWNLVGNGREILAPVFPTVGDLRNDGKTEIVLGFPNISGLTFNTNVLPMGATVLSTGWNFNAAASDWPMLHRNSRQSAVLRRVSPSAISISTPANPSNATSPTTFTIVVTPSSGGSGIPTGTVNLIDGDRNIGSCVLTSGGCSIAPTLAVGTHSLTAGYVGDKNFDVSYTSTITQSVVTTATTTALTISPSSTSLQAGSSYTLTARVTPSNGSTVPTGSVVFTIGSTTQTVAMNSSGVAAYTGTAPASSGSLSLSAAYQGSTEFSSSTSSTLTETIFVPQAATPTFSVTPGIYISAQTVAIGDTTPGGVIYYTTNGTMPTTNSTPYTGAITVSTSETIQAIAVAAGYSQSALALAAYIINLQPAVSLSPTSLSFPSTGVGSTSTLPVTVTNTGTAGLSISWIGNSGTNPTQFTHTSNCGGVSIPPKGSCTVQVSFTPTATGTFSAILQIKDNAANSPQNVALSGTGVASPTVSLSPASLSFPATGVGSTSTLPVTVTNTGTAGLSISWIGNSGTNPTQFTHTSNCGGVSIPPKGSCTVQVSFTPTATGTFSAILQIKDNAPNSPQNVTLSATGVASPAVSLSPTSLSFPSTGVGSTSTLPVTVTNTGTAGLSISWIGNSGTNPTQFTHTSNCGGVSIPPKGSCTVQVSFTPTATGTFSAILQIKDNAPNSPQNVTLTGFGSK